MNNHRSILDPAVMAAMVCIGCLCNGQAYGAKEPWASSGTETPAKVLSRTSDINRPKDVGVYYQATVPDTLDLSERARLGISHFTAIISEKDNYEMYWRGDFGNTDISVVGITNWAWPGYMWFQVSSLHACQQKCMEAMAFERLMSGSQQHLEREAKMLEMMVSTLGEDGFHYVVPHDGRKPWMGTDDTLPRANVHGQGRMMRAMIAWYQYTGDPAWKERIDKMVDGMDRYLVVHKEDYAYVPTDGWIETNDYCKSAYTTRGWKGTEEPKHEKGGEEGSLFNHQGHLAGALSTWYVLTGNEQALRLAGEMVRFLTKPQFWADREEGDYPGVVGAEHAHWQGHWHGHVNTLRAILEYAIATNDARLKAFVRDGYEWTRQKGIARIGFVGDGSACAGGRLMGVAVKLTDAGIGDYWEDIDLYIRNQGTELQFVPEDMPYLKKSIAEYSDAKRPKGLILDQVMGTGKNTVLASIGGFSLGIATIGRPFKSSWGLADSSWGNMGLFYAWEATLRYDEQTDTARVNLLLNKASPWMDIDSYLPYEGKVVLRNKKAKEVFVRIPLWVDKKAVRCSIKNKLKTSIWLGGYLWVKDLENQDMVTITFPMEERIEHWSEPPASWNINPMYDKGTIFSCRFKGNTLIEVNPPLTPHSQLYHRRLEKYKVSEAPMKQVTRYVSPVSLKW